MLQIRKQAAVEQREMLFAYENIIRTEHTYTHTQTQVTFYMCIRYKHMCCFSYSEMIKKIVNCVETASNIRKRSVGHILRLQYTH